jgi:putative endonuclease
MVDDRRAFGNRGEDMAARYLVGKGYQLLDRQYRCAFGEIDLICKQGDQYVFVEVKARKTDQYGYPEEAVTPRKIAHVVACAEHYLDSLGDVPWRVDVIAIEYYVDPPRLTHFEAIDMQERRW